MTLQASGAIAMNDINTELSIASGTTISLNDSAVRSLASIASGAISLYNFYGLSNQTPSFFTRFTTSQFFSIATFSAISDYGMSKTRAAAVKGNSAYQLFNAGNNRQSAGVLQANTSGYVTWAKIFADGNAFGYDSDTALDAPGSNLYGVYNYYTNYPTKGNFIFKIDSSGTSQWRRSFSASPNVFSSGGQALKLVMDKSSTSYFYTIFNTSYGSRASWFINKHNTSDGTVVWTTWFYPSTDGMYVSDADTDTSGNIYVLGGERNLSTGTGAVSSNLFKLNSSGTVLNGYAFRDNASNTYQCYPAAMSVDSNGNIYVSGYVSGSPYNATGGRGFLAKYNSSFVHQWTASPLTRINFINVDSSGVVTVTGTAISSQYQSIVKLNSSGTVISNMQIRSSAGRTGGDTNVSFIDSKDFMCSVNSNVFAGFPGYQALGFTHFFKYAHSANTPGGSFQDAYTTNSPPAYSGKAAVMFGPGITPSSPVTLTSLSSFSNYTVTALTVTTSAANNTLTDVTTNARANVYSYGVVTAANSSYGSYTYDYPGTYTFIPPSGVTSVSAVAVGAGGGSGSRIHGAYTGGGGGLGWRNNISVVAGSPYTVVVGGSSGYSPTYQSAQGGTSSTFSNGSVGVVGGGGPSNAGGGTYSGAGGGNGGGTGSEGGGGAGGYSGAGGNGGPNSGVGGAGGGGGNGANWPNATTNAGYGGGVGVLGQGNDGIYGPTTSYPYSPYNGFGGSWAYLFDYGGGAGTPGAYYYAPSSPYAGDGYASFPAGYAGSSGAVRVVWPGASRSFPNTNVSDR